MKVSDARPGGEVSQLEEMKNFHNSEHIPERAREPVQLPDHQHRAVSASRRLLPASFPKLLDWGTGHCLDRQSGICCELTEKAKKKIPVKELQRAK
jgi:hypothetical protein